MRYSLEPKYRNYVQGYGFLSFSRTFRDKYGKKLIDSVTKTEIDAASKFGDNKYGKRLVDTATKTGIDVAKTASKRVVQKTAEATGDLFGNKIADKITSVGKSKNKRKGKKDKANEIEEIYILPEKRQQIIDDLRLFLTPYKNGISKDYKLIRQHI